MVNATRRRLTLFAVVAAIALLETGCVRIGTDLLSAYLSDPRTRNHAYNLKVEIAFRVNDKLVKAIRYAEVGYLSGEGNMSSRPRCDSARRNCWYATNHIFIGLPGGDIMDVYLDDAKLPLDRWPDGTMSAEAHLTSILRDQPPSPHADSQGTCRGLSAETVQRDYGYPAKDRFQSDIKYDIALTKVPDREAKVLDPESIYMATIVDEVSCKRLHGRVSGGLTITPAP